MNKERTKCKREKLFFRRQVQTMKTKSNNVRNILEHFFRVKSASNVQPAILNKSENTFLSNDIKKQEIIKTSNGYML